jgi:probable HAF family extracellular repeat protein
VGYVSSTELPEIPTLWNGTTPTALGALSGVEYGSVPLGINDAGQIVGVSEYRAPPSHATIWAGNTALDLNTFLSASDVTAGWILASATAISSTGAIVGVAVNQLGGTNYVNEPYAYVLTLAPFAVGCPGANTQAVPYSSTLTALGGTPPYSFSIIGSLPPGLIFTPSKGVVSGTPTAAGVFNFAAQVTDSASNKVENSCVITVTGQTPSVTPVVTGTLGTNGWYVSKTTTLAWTLTGSPTPTTSGCGMVSVPQSTGRTYTCSATNSLGSASDSITIKKDSVPPQVTVKSPVRGKTYTLHEKVLASYSCLDSTSGVATCTGTVKDGAAINTSSKGTKTFNVSGEDKAGNKTKVSVLYNVR